MSYFASITLMGHHGDYFYTRDERFDDGTVIGADGVAVDEAGRKIATFIVGDKLKLERWDREDADFVFELTADGWRLVSKTLWEPDGAGA